MKNILRQDFPIHLDDHVPHRCSIKWRIYWEQPFYIHLDDHIPHRCTIQTIIHELLTIISPANKIESMFFLYIWVYVVSLVLPRSSAHGFSKRSRLSHFLFYVMYKYYDEAMCLRLFKLYNMTDILAISQKHTYSRCQQTN